MAWPKKVTSMRLRHSRRKERPVAKGIDFYASRRDQQEPFNEQKPIVKSKTPQESVSISQGGCNDNSMPTIVN